MSNRGPKKLPTLRDPKNPEEVAIWMREVRRLMGEVDATLEDLQTQINTISTTPVTTGVTSVTGTAPITATPTTGDVVVSIDTSGFATVPIAESDVTGLVADLAGKAPTTRTISTTAPLAGGGDLSANRTLTLGTDSSLVVSGSNLQRAALTGDVTASAGSNATTIANDAVTYAKMQNVSATSRFIGRITAGSGDPEELTGTQATTLLDTVTTSVKGLAPTLPNNAVKYFDGTGAYSYPGRTIDPWLYGIAYDGNVTMDGTTTVAGCNAPSGNVYLMNRDVFYNNLTINSGVTLKPLNKRIFVIGTLTINGTISNDGNASTTANGGTSTGARFFEATNAGGNGNVGAGSSNVGLTEVPEPIGVIDLGNNGGATNAAGSNGSDVFRGGGGGGSAAAQGGSSNINNTSGGTRGGLTVLALFNGRPDNVNATTNKYQWGAGGGGGAGNGGANSGGGGGAGGGIVWIVTKAITGTGSITALGGNGANGQGSGASGGGGGGGGMIVIFYATRSGSLTLSVAGGTGGASGGGTGKAGGNGHAGYIALINTSGDGT